MVPSAAVMKLAPGSDTWTQRPGCISITWRRRLTMLKDRSPPTPRLTNFAEAAGLLATRPELTSTLITHRFPIEDAVEAFRLAQDKSKGVFRVVVEP